MAKPRLSHFRVVLSGNTVEVFCYSKPIGYNLQSSRANTEFRGRSDKPKIHASSISRTRNNVIRLVNANAYQWKDSEDKIIQPQFLTFTFKENITGVEYANNEFTNFIKRYNYHLYKVKKALIKYLTVIEFQKRGAVHYHTIFFNTPLIDVEEERNTREIQTLWGNGFIDIIPVQSKSIGWYVAKYMTKDLAEKRLLGRRRYFGSKGLKKPVVFTQEGIATEIMKDLAQGENVAFKTRYRSPETGETFYAVYELKPQDVQEYFGQYNLNQ